MTSFDKWWGHLPPRRLALYAGILAAALLVCGLLPGPWRPTTVSAAGEWFAGVVGVVVLAWALGEPDRQRRHELERQEYDARVRREDRAEERIAQARSVVLYRTGLDRFPQPARAREYRLAGTVANHSNTPVRRVYVLVEWVPELVGQIEPLGDHDTGRLFIVDVLAPGEVKAFDNVRFRLPEGRGGHNQDIRRIKIEFYDVHGDEWVGWFGPRTYAAHIQLKASPSTFWDSAEDLRRLVPAVTELS